MKKNENPYIVQSWEKFQQEIMTPKEIAASYARVKLMCQLADLAEKSELAHSVISKMELGKSSPRVDTLVDALSSIGYHLEIVPND